jgi:hypothetical protein
MYALKSFNNKVIYIRRHFTFLLEILAFKLPWAFQNIKKLICSQTPLLTLNFSFQPVPFSKDERLIQLKVQGAGGGTSINQKLRWRQSIASGGKKGNRKVSKILPKAKNTDNKYVQRDSTT